MTYIWNQTMKTKSEMQEPVPGEQRNIPLLDAEIALLKCFRAYRYTDLTSSYYLRKSLRWLSSDFENSSGLEATTHVLSSFEFNICGAQESWGL